MFSKQQYIKSSFRPPITKTRYDLSWRYWLTECICIFLDAINNIFLWIWRKYKRELGNPRRKRFLATSRKHAEYRSDWTIGGTKGQKDEIWEAMSTTIHQWIIATIYNYKSYQQLYHWCAVACLCQQRILTSSVMSRELRERGGFN